MTSDTKVTLEFVVRLEDLDEVLRNVSDEIGGYLRVPDVHIRLGDPDKPGDDDD